MRLWKLPPHVCCSPEASGPCEKGVGGHEGARLAVLVGGWRTGAVCAVYFSPELTAGASLETGAGIPTVPLWWQARVSAHSFSDSGLTATPVAEWLR